MCKVLVTFCIPLLLVIAANGVPLNREILQSAIKDVIQLENMNIPDNEFYTPEDFSNDERRMKALHVYKKEIDALKKEIQQDVNINEVQDAKIYNTVGHITTSLEHFKNIMQEWECEDCELKSTREFLKGLRTLLNSMYSNTD